MTARRPVEQVLGAGALTGFVAAAAAGAIDAVWGWAPAAQFVPGIGRRLRFVVYTALSHGAVGLVVGLVAAAVIVGLARGTRLGTLTRFAFGYHDQVRAADRRDAVVGVSVVIAGVPVMAAAIDVAYRIGVPTVLASHAKGLAVLVVIAVTLALVAGAGIVAFVVARPIELALRPLAARWAPVSSVWAPFVTAAALIAIGLAAWAHAEWETVQLLHLRGAVVGVVAAVLAIPASGVAWRLTDFARAFRLRWIAWGALLIALPVLVLATGGNAAVIKAASAYTGLGGPVARVLRKAADRDHDGYARWLGGGDCDDGDPTVHPGAPEVPGDGIDQNCIGGDAPAVPPKEDVAFAPVNAVADLRTRSERPKSSASDSRSTGSATATIARQSGRVPSSRWAAFAAPRPSDSTSATSSAAQGRPSSCRTVAHSAAAPTANGSASANAPRPSAPPGVNSTRARTRLPTRRATKCAPTSAPNTIAGVHSAVLSAFSRAGMR
jgi:hypothetical protein